MESLAESPAIMTHASVPVEVRRQLSIDDTLVRLSVGIEALPDLIQDIDNALLQVSEVTDTHIQTHAIAFIRGIKAYARLPSHKQTLAPTKQAASR